MKNVIFWTFLALITATIGASAAIEWENNEVTLAAKPTDKSVSGTFKFKNTGDSPVTITEVRPTCGCTTTELTKTTYRPGESGSIVAHFDIGSRVGEQAKEIVVTSDDRPNAPKVLVFKVIIDDPLSVTGASMTWESTGKPAPQQFKIQAREGYKIHIADVRTSNRYFAAKLTTVEEGASYVIDVTPTTLDEKAFGLLVVTTDYPATDPRVLYAKLRIQ
ncbi:MAG TPA: DUF1573 domain-containing protein [Chthoniobacterales bacterium]